MPATQIENSCPVCKQSFTRIRKRRSRINYNEKWQSVPSNRHGSWELREETTQVEYKKQTAGDVNFLLALMDFFSRYQPRENITL